MEGGQKREHCPGSEGAHLLYHPHRVGLTVAGASSRAPESLDSYIPNVALEKSLDYTCKTRDGGYLNLESITETYEAYQASPVLTLFQSELFCGCLRWGCSGKTETGGAELFIMMTCVGGMGAAF